MERMEKSEDNIELHIFLEEKENFHTCPICDSKITYIRKRAEKTVRELPVLDSMIVYYHHPVNFYECKGCRKTFQKRLPDVEESQVCTNKFKMFIGKMANMLTPAQVAREFRLDDNTVYRYEDYFLKKNSSR